MEEQLITLETAKLAKEKKFDVYCKVGFIEQLEDKTSLHIKPGIEVDYLWEPSFEEPEDYWQAVLDMEQPEIKYYPRPTQSLLQKWLWDKNKIWIEVTLWGDGIGFICVIKQAKGKEDDGSTIVRQLEAVDVGLTCSEPTKALEKGLQKALKLI